MMIITAAAPAAAPGELLVVNGQDPSEGVGGQLRVGLPEFLDLLRIDRRDLLDPVADEVPVAGVVGRPHEGDDHRRDGRQEDLSEVVQEEVRLVLLLFGGGRCRSSGRRGFRSHRGVGGRGGGRLRPDFRGERPPRGPGPRRRRERCRERLSAVRSAHDPERCAVRQRRKRRGSSPSRDRRRRRRRRRRGPSDHLRSMVFGVCVLAMSARAEPGCCCCCCCPLPFFLPSCLLFGAFFADAGGTDFALD
mmetsp:Transcript_2140/g.5667  ORF Transcript_2140/g.5667 Transcript_2140/m.5667 type:complete len:248 (-) Transcript_2140:112-855(-)